MKKLIMTILLCCILLLGAVGCDENQKVTPEQLQQFAVQAEQLTVQLDEYQAAADEVVNTLKSYGVIDANIVASAKNIQGEIDRIQPQVRAITEAIKATPYTGDDFGFWLAVLQSVNQASVLWNPYVATGSAVLTLVSMVFALIKRKEANSNALKYQAHKQGVEKTMKEVSALGDEVTRKVESQLYNNIGEARAALGVK